ncbi:hypothetical protein [Acinetobacter seifertii]|uniref:hypothetical protein n=1 Tax=Acinetobacter seifertii TaxID=1530123 RepID=UPI0032B32D76
MKKILAASLIFSSLIMVGCDSGMKKPDEPTVSREAKFTSIPQCLAYVQMDIVPKLKIVEDTPLKTWGGFEGTDGSFSCELVQTGIEGTYVKGNYQVYKSALR